MPHPKQQTGHDLLEHAAEQIRKLQEKKKAAEAAKLLEAPKDGPK